MKVAGENSCHQVSEGIQMRGNDHATNMPPGLEVGYKNYIFYTRDYFEICFYMYNVIQSSVSTGNGPIGNVSQFFRYIFSAFVSSNA